MSICAPPPDPERKGDNLEVNLKKLCLKRPVQEMEAFSLPSTTSSIMKTLHAVDDYTSLLGNHPTVDRISDATALRCGFLSYKRSRRADGDRQHYSLNPDPWERPGTYFLVNMPPGDFWDVFLRTSTLHTSFLSNSTISIATFSKHLSTERKAQSCR